MLCAVKKQTEFIEWELRRTVSQLSHGIIHMWRKVRILLLQRIK